MALATCGMILLAIEYSAGSTRVMVGWDSSRGHDPAESLAIVGLHLRFLINTDER